MRAPSSAVAPDMAVPICEKRSASEEGEMAEFVEMTPASGSWLAGRWCRAICEAFGMRLDDYLGSVHPDVRHAVNDRLNAMAAYGDAVGDTALAALRRMADNLRADHRPPEGVWADLCARLFVVALDVGGICDAVREWGNTDDRAFLIPVTCLGSNAILGHFMTLEHLARRMTKSDPSLDETTARQLLLDLIAAADIARQQQRLKGILLSRNLLWATFDPGDPKQDPCTQLPNDRTTICACLALDRATVGDDLLGLRYALPAGIAPCFPTVMAAACGKPWSEFWAPAAEGEPYGWTQPWPGHAAAYACPEVVHHTIDGAPLALPIRRFAS